MTTTYRYIFADLLTNSVLGELPITGVSFNQQLNQAGTLQARILLSGVDGYEYNVDASTIPARTAIYVDRDGVIVWGGVIWGREYNSANQTLSITAREFESYFERRRITTDVVFTNVDQMTIAQTLFNTAQAAPYGNIGVIVPTNTSGVLVSRTYYGYEYKQVYAAVQDLSRQLDGFDFNIRSSYSSGEIIKTLQMGYPRIGTIYSPTDPSAVVFNFPAGNIVEYAYPEDGSIAANTIYGLGAGSNEGKLLSTASDATKYAEGWALLEDQANYSDVTDATLLSELAQGQVSALSYPPTTIKVVVPAYVDPVFGTYSIGDDARLIITDSRFPTGLDQVYRIVGLNVQPGEDSPERVTLTLTTTSNQDLMAYINQPPDLRAIQADIESRLRKLETATRFTFPNVTSDPSNPRKGDAWLNITTNQAKIVDANGTVRILNWT